MKKIIVVFIILVAIVGGIWWYSSSNKNKEVAKNENTYNTQKIDTNVNTSNNTNNNVSPAPTPTKVIAKKETEMASFSTKIYNKDPERQNNITITCKAISGTEIPAGETFSFCDTVGKATTAKGYQEADIYVDGKKEQGLGGGNCQVSTTLYNAILEIPELEVTERHQHSGHVPYIQDGKDAAVAYGSYDLKFKNNTNDVIKIVMENTSDSVTAKIIKIS